MEVLKMVTNNDIKEYAAKNMRYTGVITPYIKAQVLKRMGVENEDNTTDNDIEVKEIEKKTKPKTKKSKSTKGKVGKVLSTIGKGVKVTANYLQDCSERSHEYNSPQKISVKSKAKKKSTGKSINKMSDTNKLMDDFFECDAPQKPKTRKTNPKKKSVSKPKKKSVSKPTPKTTLKTPKRKTTAKIIRKTSKKSLKTVRDTQRDFEDEIMRCF